MLGELHGWAIFGLSLLMGAAGAGGSFAAIRVGQKTTTGKLKEVEKQLKEDESKYRLASDCDGIRGDCDKLQTYKEANTFSAINDLKIMAKETNDSVLSLRDEVVKLKTIVERNGK